MRRAAPATRWWAVLGVVAVAVFVLVVLPSGDSPYTVNLQMAEAEGVRKSSDVRVGGVSVGKVVDLELVEGDRVNARLELDDDDVAIGRGAIATIKAVNLLGENYISLDPGDPVAPLGDGATIPAERVRSNVTLDQVLDVLDPDTRMRLKVMLGELGATVVGRGADLNEVLRQLPGGFAQGQELLEALVKDNEALGRTIEHSDRFIARLTREDRAIARAIDSSQGAASTFAARTRELRASLREAPATLATARRFLTDLETTARPLGPAARTLTRTAGPLQETLAALPAFRKAAQPALEQAEETAPSLTRLGREATPVLRAAAPTTRTLASFLGELRPFSHMLRYSIDGLLGTLEGWGRAIQGRDSLGHVFHGQVTVGANALRTILDASAPKEPAKAKRRPSPRAPSRPSLQDTLKDTVENTVKPKLEQTLPKAPSVPDVAGGVVESLKDLVGGLAGPRRTAGVPAPAPSGSPKAAAPEDLLDFLLGR